MNPLDDTLNVGATLPRQNQATGTPAEKPLIDDLADQQTIRMPGSGSLVFNRYRLQRVLGRGGMGVVWLAVDTKLERAVALKFLPDIIGADPVALKELKDETRRGLDLAHPNIVRIYDFVDDDEAAAISMEFVDGKSLSERRVAKPHQVFSVEEIGPWVGQMCDALDYAHMQKRIVHRDLKPANLMVNSESEIKITDFGIARSVTDTMSRLSRDANHGTSGTLLYMSPQQAMGDRPRPTDDIYAVGATLYELLTGKPPFYSGDITMQITTKTAPPLKQRREELEIRAADQIPKEWEEAIASCLEKDPALRPQTAGELARRLGVSVKAEAKSAQVKTKAGGLKQIEMKPSAQGAGEEKKSSPVLLVAGLVAALVILGSVTMGGLWWWFHRAGEWVVQTEPKGVLISVNDVTCVAPATVEHLKPGSYKASLSLDGYEPRQVEFKVAAGQRVELGVVKLERSTGGLTLSSDPDGAKFEVKSATDENAPKVTGETPKTIRLPIGKYEIVMKHEGESKTGEVQISRNADMAHSFNFTKPLPPPPPPPVVAAAPTPPITTPPASSSSSAPTVAAASTPPAPAQNPPAPADTPPASTPAPAMNAVGPSAGGATPSAATIAAATQAAAPAGAPSPVISAAPSEGPPGPNMAAIIAAQAAVDAPEAGYWKLNEIFSNSEYSGYSESGRRYLLYKAQAVLKEKDHYHSGVDGSPGKGTHKAIQSFQTASALQPNGQLDSATMASLGLTGLPDKTDWASSSRSESSRSSDDRTPESEKTKLRKIIERNVLGGRDLRDMFRR